MKWTDDDEAKWREMTQKRESNKKAVGINALVKDLRSLADSMERGDYEHGEINIEFVRGMEIYGHEGPAPIVARKITVTVKVPK